MSIQGRILSLAGKTILATVALMAPLTGIAQEVIPDFYRDPGLYPNRSYVNQSFNEHIDPFTGSLQHHYVDLHLPGNGGFDLKVIRSYNSALVDPLNPGANESLAGLGWTIHFGRVLKTKDTICFNDNGLSVGDNPVLELPDGSRQLFAFTGTSAPLMLTTQRWRADCSGAGMGLTVYSPDGTRYDMTKAVNAGTAVNPIYAWYTTKITDRNGNSVTINYAPGANPEITSISTSDGRAISFTYADSGTASRRITQISGAGKTYSYSYQAVSGVSGRYFLTNVARPGGTSWNYSYNLNLGATAGSYVMKQATYPQGGAIDYSYSFVYFDSQSNPASRATVVTAKSLSGGGNWSFSYTPGGVGNYDTTNVTTPSGTVTYRHIGPNYSASGSVWMVGLLISKNIGGIQTETYTWGKQKISGENYFRPGAFVTKVDAGETNAPILTQKQITRNGATYTTSYSGFDSYGNPGTVAESGPNGGNRTTSLTYYINTAKWIVKQIQNETYSGSAITRSFDGNGNLTSMSQDGVTTMHSFDSQGNIASTTFPKSLTHSYSNYKRGIPQSESQPEGIAISRIVSDAGNVTSETNGEGRTTTYSYDGLNRVTFVGYPTGSSVSISYGANTRTATRGSLTESTAYDGFGRPVSITLGGIQRAFTFDALGRQIFVSSPDSVSGTSYQYDILERPVRITNPDDSSRTISYGAGVKTVVDERGRSTTYSYRAYGDPGKAFLMNIAAPDASASISLTRNSKDLVTAAAQGGITRSYGYNANYYLTSVTNPETGTTAYGRDAAGNMTSRSVGASGTTSYGYDGQNRLVSIAYPGNTPAVTQTYSRTHKLLSANSAAASRSYTYDANDNLTGETVAVDGLVFTTGYAYNGLDQLSAVTYPRSGRIVNYAPDVLGRPTQVSGYISSIAYWPSGQVRQINYANGTVTGYGQNFRLWPASFSTQKNGVYYVNSNYTYDGAGNLTGISDTTDTSYNRTLAYDNIDRLTTINGPWGSGTIAYNGAGNITSQVLGGWSLFYSYDGTNRLANVSGSLATSYGYDAYGNVTTRAGNTYTYDGVPHLRCINCSNATDKIEYSYDGAQQRVSVTKSGVKSYEVYGPHGNQLIEYTPSQSDRLVEYIYLGGKRIAQRVTP